MNRSLCFTFLVSATAAFAFPPAPHYTLFGLVRDQVGQRVVADGAEIILYRGGQEIGRAPITANFLADRNYELRIRIDANRPNTTLYNAAALPAQGQFSVAVEMNGALFYPIEAGGTLTAGKGGEQRRLDLNLGADSDGDGIPDIWEEWQLYQAGLYPDESGNWPIHLIDRNGDFDHDGRSNWAEYVAGTFAGDAGDHFDLEIRDTGLTLVRLEFYAITGKTYTLEGSPDGRTWSRVPFSLGEDGEAFDSHTAAAVGIVPIFCARPAGPRQLYRMNVQ